MLSAPRTLVSFCLLLVLCASVLTSTMASAGSDSSSGGQNASLIGTLDQLWALIERVVKTATQSALTRVDTQLEDVNARLSSQGSDLSTRLEGVSGRLEGMSGRLDRLEAEVGACQAGSKPPPLPRDCSELPTGATSGVHLLQPGLEPSQPPVPAFCDLEEHGGNWTIIQRRADIKPRLNFYRPWADYREGFGELDKEFWWGLDNIWAMTSSRDRRYELRIDLEDFDAEKRHAVYSNFRVGSESTGYRLTVTDYSGDAVDGMDHHNGAQFSTKDRDNDASEKHCAQSYKGGWWYNICHHSNLNGQYLSGQHASHADGINWGNWRGNHYSLKTAIMRIRPTRKTVDG